MEAFKKRVDEAKSTIKLQAIGNNDAAKALQRDLERSDPEVGVEVAAYYQARWDALEAAERGGQ